MGRVEGRLVLDLGWKRVREGIGEGGREREREREEGKAGREGGLETYVQVP